MTGQYFLSKGLHSRAADGRCAMEWVSYLAGERHSDQPVCVSPVLRRYCIALNDRLDDEQRQKLRPYLARTIGTAGDGKDPERLRLCCEWLIRTALPDWCEFAGWDDLAEQLRSMSDAPTAESTVRAIGDIRDEAWSRRSKVRADAAAAAVAAAAAAAAAAADAVAVAVAVAAAVADADADAVAAAVADADAAAVAGVGVDYDTTYKATYDKVKPIVVERTADIRARHTVAAFDLLDRMLPKEMIELPVVDDADLVCGGALR
jgi:hypothetical protein